MVDHRTEDTGDRKHRTGRRFDPPRAFDHETDIDDLLSILSHRRRRAVLFSLSERAMTDAETVAAMIAAQESDGEPTPAQRSAVLVDLTHNHLPKLADRGLIEYDRRSGAIRQSPLPDVVTELLDCCRSLEDESIEGRS